MLENLDTLAVMIVALMVGHSLMDYPLQGDFLSRAKNHKNPIPGISPTLTMEAHCILHAAAVWIITGSFLLSVAEYLCHYVIDRLKCAGRFGFETDQYLHFTCKVLWATIIVFVSHDYLVMVKFPVLGL